jgi:hypothetical protein
MLSNSHHTKLAKDRLRLNKQTLTGLSSNELGAVQGATAAETVATVATAVMMGYLEWKALQLIYYVGYIIISDDSPEPKRCQVSLRPRRRRRISISH